MSGYLASKDRPRKLGKLPWNLSEKRLLKRSKTARGVGKMMMILINIPSNVSIIIIWIYVTSKSLLGWNDQLLMDFGARFNFFMLTSLLIDIFWSRKVIFRDIMMCLFHEIGPIMSKMVFGGFCLVDTSYQKTEKIPHWKSYELKVLQILIRSVVPTSSYGWTKYSNFNVTEYRLAKSWEPKKSHFWYSDFFGYM